jgi:hypothetical protein
LRPKAKNRKYHKNSLFKFFRTRSKRPASKHVYISVIQNSSFLSLPITHRGRVLCQLNPAPTVADPITTGCNRK